MKSTRKHTIFKICYILLIIAFVLYIFSNSIESKSESASKSGNIVETINKVLEEVNAPIKLTDVFVRKTAHFVEFFVLGTLLFGFTFFDKKVYYTNEIYACFIACLVAMTDETIQYFSKRGSMLLDVWLDFLSATLAITFFYLIYKIYNKRKQKHG